MFFLFDLRVIVYIYCTQKRTHKQMFNFFYKGINLFRQNGLLVVTFDTTTSGRNKHLAPVSLFPFL